ncbi:MAG: hypothetical protein Q8R21_06625, partial [Burkholderiales bacterium]|nr:hypothetical protein [Burkholderiales bacterium]
SAVFAASAVFAQSTGGGRGANQHDHGSAGHEPMMRQGMGPGMGGGGGMGRGPVGMLTTQDANSAADMGITMNLVHENTKIRRTVTRLPDGIRTVTESDDPKIAQDIKAHVASMSGRLQEGKEFNIFSTTLPVIFDNAKNIKSKIEFTAKGAIVTRTSPDPKVATALQAHADEVTELVKEGPVAFHRGIDARMAMGPGGPRGARAGAVVPAAQGRQQQHAH